MVRCESCFCLLAVITVQALQAAACIHMHVPVNCYTTASIVATSSRRTNHVDREQQSQHTTCVSDRVAHTGTQPTWLMAWPGGGWGMAHMHMRPEHWLAL